MRDLNLPDHHRLFSLLLGERAGVRVRLLPSRSGFVPEVPHPNPLREGVWVSRAGPGQMRLTQR
jgi:hypothetical protein